MLAILTLTMHVLLIKQPRKPGNAIIVDKKSLRLARDIISTMKVMKPKWKCELITAEKFTKSKGIIPLDVLKQAIIKPLTPETPMTEAILSLL